MSLRIALAQYPIERLGGFEDWAAKVERWLAEAAREGAHLAVFPEYAGMELTGIFTDEVAGDLEASIAALQVLVPRIIDLHADLARRYDIHLVAGSLPVMRAERYRNAAHVFSPQGLMGVQEKRVMTRFEREAWGVSPGDGIAVFEAPFGRFALSICYDIEFPNLARAQAEGGAALILAPSCTDTAHGLYRVRAGARARALENQCYVATAATVGEAPWSPALDVNVGAASVFGPPDAGFPHDGTVADGAADAAGWVFADLDLEAVTTVRQNGAVLNFRHWAEQPAGETARLVRG